MSKLTENSIETIQPSLTVSQLSEQKGGILQMTVRHPIEADEPPTPEFGMTLCNTHPRETEVIGVAQAFGFNGTCYENALEWLHTQEATLSGSYADLKSLYTRLENEERSGPRAEQIRIMTIMSLTAEDAKDMKARVEQILQDDDLAA